MHIFTPNFTSLHPFDELSVRHVRRKHQKHQKPHNNTITLQSLDQAQDHVIKDRRRSLTAATNPRRNTNQLIVNGQLIDWLAGLSSNSKRNEGKVLTNNSSLKLRVRKTKNFNYQSIPINSSPLRLVRDNMMLTKRTHQPQPFLLAKKVQYQPKNTPKPKIADVRMLSSSGAKVFYRKGNMTPVLFQQNSQYRPWSPTKKEYEQQWEN